MLVNQTGSSATNSQQIRVDTLNSFTMSNLYTYYVCVLSRKTFKVTRKIVILFKYLQHVS